MIFREMRGPTLSVSCIIPHSWVIHQIRSNELITSIHLPLLSDWGYTVTSGLMFLLPWPPFWGEPCLQLVSQSKPLCHLFIYYLLYFYYLWSVYSKISWIRMWIFIKPQPFFLPHFLISPALLFHHKFTYSFLKIKSSESSQWYQNVFGCRIIYLNLGSLSKKISPKKTVFPTSRAINCQTILRKW